MKVIFDSKDEKEDFMEEVSTYICPRYWGLEELNRCDPPIDCRECWEKAMEMEVRENENKSIEERQNAGSRREGNQDS